MNDKKPELLSPAGSYEALTSAIYGGCNAVYLGGENFGARANAANFSNDDLLRALDFAHLHNIKIYYTANTLIKEAEIPAFLEQIHYVYQEGIDGLIIQDIGAYQILKNNFPDLPLHGSTQMTVHSLSGVKFLEKLGFERAVLSRELSLQEINYIIEHTNIEIECFVHGALCYSYSGQCLFSSLIGGRSGNRGTCAQPCRLPYTLLDKNQKEINTQGKYLLSPKDIQTLEILPDIIQSGIHSLKIEGRMKNAQYVGLVTALYRKYIDLFLENPDKYFVSDKDLTDILQIYNRGGFSKGYYYTKNGLDMMSPLRPNHQGIAVGKVKKITDSRNLILELSHEIAQGDCLEIQSSGPEPISFTAKENMSDTQSISLDTRNIRKGYPVYKLTSVKLANEIEKNILQKKLKQQAKLFFTAQIGHKSMLKLKYQDFEVVVEGDIVEAAKTRAITEDEIRTQLNKTGNDPIEFSSINLSVDQNIFIQIKEINRMRREAIEQLLLKLSQSKKRKLHLIKYNKVIPVNPMHKTQINVLIRNMEQFEIVQKYDIDSLYVEHTGLALKDLYEILDQCEKRGITVYIALPRVIRNAQERAIKQSLEALNGHTYKGVLIRTLDAFELGQKFGEVIIDYTANVFNNPAIRFWEQQSVKRIGISLELNQNELAKLEKNLLEIVIYGYVPLMTTTQCIHQFSGSCQGKKQEISLKDRKNMILKTVQDCKMCLNTIYNPLPVVLIDKYKDLEANGIKQYRLEFLDEATSDIHAIMNYAMEIKNRKVLNATDLESISSLKNYTRGHWARGVK